MKFAKIEPHTSLTEDYWRAYIEHAAIWRRFSPAQRREILAMPIIAHSPTGYGYRDPDMKEIERRPAIDKLLKSIDCDPNNERFHALIRMMQVCHAGGDVFAPDRNPAELGDFLLRYLLSKDAAYEFNANLHDRYSNYSEPFRGVELELPRFDSRSRLHSFLAIPEGETAVRWESQQRQGSKMSGSLNCFAGKIVCDFSRQILTRLVAAPGPVALTALLNGIKVDKKQVSQLAKALHALTEYVFSIPAYDADGSDLVLGLWPGLRKRLESSALQPPPAAPTPATIYVAPFLCADIAAVVVHAATNPITLKNGQGGRMELYAAEERKLAALFDEVPSWVCKGLFDPRVRASVSAFAAASFGWLTLDLPPHMRFTISDAGRAWLALQPAVRLENFLKNLRAARWNRKSKGFSSLPFCHVTGHIRRTSSADDILACENGITAAFHQVSTDVWMDSEAWLDYAARAHNPIAATVGADACVVIPKQNRWGEVVWVKRDAESLEAEARTMLADFLFKRLVPLGGAELGVGAGKHTVFRLNEIGRYYIGAIRKFPACGDAPNGRVIVQPNFEIMFLGPHMLAEADLSAFCERTGAKSGAIFRITRQSIQQALHKGETADCILSTLRRLSDCDLPANVATEILGWSSSRKTFVTRPATLLVCPDAIVATRIRSLLPNTTVPLNDTTLELTTPITTQQQRKLEAAGLFKQR